MKRLFSLILLFLVAHALVMAQELTVKSFALAEGDLTASTHRRNDANGQACALVKVLLARPGATFLGNVMGDTPYSQSEYYVYMMKGAYKLQVKLDGYIPVIVNFKDWGISGVEPLTTYILSINLPNVVAQSFDDGKSYFTLTVTPPNAALLLDGELYALDKEGRFSGRLPRGHHTYQLTADSYATKHGSFTLDTERKDLRETLVPAQTTLTVTCPMPGVDIYVNDEKKASNSSWSGALKSGSYLVEARKDGYFSQQKSITLSDNQNLTVELPDLIARVGQLDVNYTPFDAEVWIDGKKVGIAPNLFKNIVIGKHQVEISKEGYQSETKTVSITEGQTATLSGSLASLAATATPSTLITANASSTANSSAASGTTADRQKFTVNGVSFTMVRVEGGTFTMGATTEQGSEALSAEKPAHQVTLSSFSIGETEVTQELWEAVMGNNPSYFKGAKRPVEQVSWNDCQEFVKRLSEKTGKTFRLPTESEWEYAVRGGNKSQGYKYSGSNDIDAVAWYDKNSFDKGETSPDFGTHEVATKRANELDLFDMSGNVFELCSNWLYSYSIVGAKNDSYIVSRGGSWNGYATNCRSSFRLAITPDFKNTYLGFRLAFSE